MYLYQISPLSSVNFALSNFFALYLQHKNLLADMIEAVKNRQSYSNDPMLPGPNDNQLLEMIFTKNMETISQEFYSWLKNRYNIDMNRLLENRPAYSDSDLPTDIIPVADSVDLLIAEIVKQPGLVTAEELKKFKDDRTRLRNDISYKQHKLSREEQEILEAVVRGNVGPSPYRNNNIKELEMQLNRLKQEFLALANSLKSRLKVN